MEFESVTGINSDLITTSWKASKIAYQTEHYHKEEAETIVFFAFKPSFSENDWFAPANESPFGVIKMMRNQFPCMRSIGNDVDATVNQAFLENLEVIVHSRTSFCDSVKMAVEKRQEIVFTGHSSGGATAILATVWYLETHFKQNPNICPKPRCVTFGAPLVGDYIFNHALSRENWSQFFVNFVTRFDIVPRIMLSQRASSTMHHILNQLASFQAGPILSQAEQDRSDPRVTDFYTKVMQDTSAIAYQAEQDPSDPRITDFYTKVMQDTSTVAYQVVCELIGNKEAFFSSFLVLSPYRPIGTFVFSTGTRLVSLNNSNAILQILFYASQSSNKQELSQIPNLSIRDHHIHSYEELVQSMRFKFYNHFDMHHLSLDGAALNDLGLSTRAKQCVSASLEAEKQRVSNQKKIENKMPKIIEKLKWIEEEYKPICQTHKIGYYDSFKTSNKKLDFEANVMRMELGGMFDEVLGLVKKGRLPDGFEVGREWVELATRYRRLVEPLDIANYYRNLKNEDAGPYMSEGRPSRYKHAQRVYEHELFKTTGMIAEHALWSKVNALNLGYMSQQEMQKKLEIARSTCGSCLWAEVEELNNKPYEEVEARIKTLEGLLDGWIQEKEVDHNHMFMKGSIFSKWWHSLPHNHKLTSPLKEHFMGETSNKQPSLVL